MNKDSNLKELAEALSELVAILNLDPNCSWTKGFESDLSRCEELIQNGYNEEDLQRLSSSVTSVFQGMGSFNDYAPGTFNRNTGRYDTISGAENFEQTAKKVFDAAVLLK